MRRCLLDSADNWVGIRSYWLVTRWRQERLHSSCNVLNGLTQWRRCQYCPPLECSVRYSSVQSLSHVQFFVTPMDFSNQASQFITNSRNLHKLMSIALVMPSNHLILCHSLLLPPSIFPSLRVFAIELVLCIRWPKYWSFSFSVSPSNEYLGLDGLVGSPCNPRDSQESSSTPQFKSINSSTLSFLYSPILMSIHDFWKNHSWQICL